MNRRFRVLWYLFFYLGQQMAQAQLLYPTFKHLNQNNGLSNNTAYSLFKDSRKLLWVGTIEGLNRFDGSICKIYRHHPQNPDSTLANGAVTTMLEDQSGNLWIGNETGLNFYDYKTDKISRFYFTEAGYNNNYCNPIHFEGPNSLLMYLSSDKRGLFRLNLKTHNLELVSPECEAKCFAIPQTPYKQPHTIFSQASVGIRMIGFQSGKAMPKQTLFDGTGGLPSASIGDRMAVENDSILWLGGNLGLIRFNWRTKSYRIFNQFEGRKIQSIGFIAFRPKSEQMIVGTGKEGLLVFDRNTLKFTQQVRYAPTDPNGLLANESDKILIDKDDNLFVSLPRYGVDYANLGSKNLTKWLTKSMSFEKGILNNYVTATVELLDGHIWCGLEEEGLVVLNKEGQILQTIRQREAAQNQVNHLLSDSKNRIWVATKDGLSLMSQTGQITQKILQGHVCNFVQPTTVNEFFVTTNHTLFRIEDVNGRLKVSEIEAIRKQNSDYNQQMYYDAATQKLFVAIEMSQAVGMLEKQPNGEWEYQKFNFLRGFISSFFSVAQSDSLYACTRAGVIQFDKKNLGYRLLPQFNGLNQSFVVKYLPDKKSNFWLVTGNGLFQYNQDTHKMAFFDHTDGAVSYHFSANACLLLRDGRWLLGGMNGLNVLDAGSNKTEKRVQVLFNNLKVNNTLFANEWITPLDLDFQHNTISCQLLAIDYDNPENIRFQYRLLNHDREWITVANAAEIRYTDLEVGNYQLLVRAISTNGVLLSREEIRQVQIAPPLVKTWWFRSLIVLTIAAIVYFLYRLQIERQRREADLAQLKAETETKALRAQMNPHFVFNCMNTIEYYIVSKQTHKAALFLQNFSLLIRNVLENSQHELIHLEQEIETLRLYIELERERADGQFDYVFENSQNLDLNAYQIPPLLLQPFVENAILHGLRHKSDGKGTLRVGLKIENKKLHIEISDNGIGRAAAAIINAQKARKGHSMGLDVTRGRIKALEVLYGNQTSCDIFDVSPSGTRVLLSLPILPL